MSYIYFSNGSFFFSDFGEHLSEKRMFLMKMEYDWGVNLESHISHDSSIYYSICKLRSTTESFISLPKDHFIQFYTL